MSFSYEYSYGSQISAFSVILTLALGIYSAVVMWKVFEKAGEKGWKAIIPVYNAVVLCKIMDINPWILLLALGAVIPILGIVFAIVLLVYMFKGYKNLSESFGKEPSFAWGLLFLNIIFLSILAFGDCEYKKLKKQ